MRWSWVNFQCRGVLLVWTRVGQRPVALAVGAGCLDNFTLIYPVSFLSPSLWERPDKGSLSPKTTNQQTFNIYLYLVLFLYITRITINYNIPHLKSPKNQNRRVWLVGCFGFNGPLRQYFSLYQTVFQREGEKKRNDRRE